MATKRYYRIEEDDFKQLLHRLYELSRTLCIPSGEPRRTNELILEFKEDLEHAAEEWTVRPAAVR